jgi:hypothetical protein
MVGNLTSLIAAFLMVVTTCYENKSLKLKLLDKVKLADVMFCYLIEWVKIKKLSLG